MKTIINMTIATCLLPIAFNASANSPVEKEPEVELTHWWNHPGEISALNEIKKAVEARDGKFVDTKVASWDKLRSSVINRLTMGYPPAITQWLGSNEGLGLNGIKAVYSAPAKWRGKSLKDTLFEEVFDSMVDGDKLISLPLGIHIQNSALYNAAIYKELDLPLPASWEMFLEQAKVIKAAGYVPIALSNEVWQLYMVFNTILLDQIGLQDHLKLYKEDQSMEKWRAPLEASFNVLLKLKQFADEGHKARSWNNAIEMVGNKEAAMNIMGDFAKGELTAMGLEAGKDFLCALSPGSRGAMLYVVDGFLMLNVEEDYLRKGQSILIDAVLDPTVQAAYNSKKGSIPVIKKGVDVTQLDSCSRKIYNNWITKGKGQGKGETAHGTGNQLRASFFEAVIGDAWNTENPSAEKLADQLISMVELDLNSSKRAEAKTGM